MDKPHFSGKVAVKAIIARGGEILMTRDHRDDKLWDLPGGRIHEGESIEAALKREVAEELGVEAKVGPLVHSEQVVHTGDGAPHIFITFKAELKDPEAQFQIPSPELAEVKWVDENGFNQLKTFDNCKHAIAAYWR